MTTPVGNSDDGAMFSTKPEEMETFTGRFVNLLEPNPDTIVIEDIAHHLSVMTRYGGAVKKFYSVAEHSCLVADLISWVPFRPASVAEIQYLPTLAEMQLACLMHDAPEAYLNDITAPAKFAMRELMATWIESYLTPYDYLEEKFAQIIGEIFRIKYLGRPEVKVADLWAMKIEARELTHSGGSTWRWNGKLPLDGRKPDNVSFEGGLEPEVAEQMFITTFRELVDEINEGVETKTKEEANGNASTGD